MCSMLLFIFKYIPSQRSSFDEIGQRCRGTLPAQRASTTGSSKGASTQKKGGTRDLLPGSLRMVDWQVCFISRREASGVQSPLPPMVQSGYS